MMAEAAIDDSYNSHDYDHNKESSLLPNSTIQWSSVRLCHYQNVDNHNNHHPNNTNNANTESQVLEVSNPHVPLSTNHGLRLFPNFCSDDEIQNILDDLEHERSSWEGFQQRRRVYRYDVDAKSNDDDDDDNNNLPSSLQLILNRFERQFTGYYQPLHVVVEDYPPVNSMRINSSQKIFTTFESSSICPTCGGGDGGDDSKNKNNNHEHENTTRSSSSSSSCCCFVAEIPLLPQAAIEHWNQPARRDPQCYQLASSNHWTDVRLPRGSLLLKTGESLWQWRTSVVTSGIPPSHAKFQPGPMEQPLPRIVLLKLYRLPPLPSATTTNNSNSGNNTATTTKTTKDEHDKNVNNNHNDSSSQTKVAPDEKVFGYVPSPLDFIPPPDAAMPSMHDLLTIIITTSPIRSHPSTELLERTMSTFALAGPDFVQCRKVIICDGFRLRDDPESTNNNNNTTTTTAIIPNVTKRHGNIKQALRNGINNIDSPFCHTQVVELESRHGYGFALRHALQQHHYVSTRFVCVIQHDRTFMRPTPMQEALHCMWRNPNIKYIGMSMRSNALYRDVFRGRYGPDAALQLGELILRPPELVVDANLYGPNSQSFHYMMNDSDLSDQVRESNQTLYDTYHAHAQRWEELDRNNSSNNNDGGRPLYPAQQSAVIPTTTSNCHQMMLMPTLYWYDNTHLAETVHYRDFIFDPRYKMVARGGFVEDKLSPVLVKTVDRLGLAQGHARFGCFLLDDASGLFFTGHLDGGSYLTQEQRIAMQTQNYQQQQQQQLLLQQQQRVEAQQDDDDEVENDGTNNM